MVGLVINTKKRMMECPRHRWTLFRCKRVCHKSTNSKDKGYNSGYTEKCFKCILEKRYKQKPEIKKKRNKFISLR